jgi:SH3-like domain-containing protein
MPLALLNSSLSVLQSKQLIAKRTVVVNATAAKIRTAADEGSAIVFVADKGVLLDIAEPVASGWIKVKHVDGQTGFIKLADIWGV